MIEKKKLSGIKSWPEDDRPREKLLKKGAGTLSNSGLLAILLRTGTNGTSAIEGFEEIWNIEEFDMEKIAVEFHRFEVVVFNER